MVDKKIASWDKDFVLVNRILYPVKTLGFGDRVGIWFQGCSIQCRGCMARYTWNFDESYAMSFEEVEKKLKDYIKFNPSGVTISGGEPFDQPPGLCEVVKICRKLNYREILVYSGYTFEYLLAKYSKILNLVDILVSGPFIEELTTEKVWRGSDNQKIYVISPRAKENYKEIDLDSLTCSDTPPIQVEVFDGYALVIGIPRRDDLGRLVNLLRERWGIELWEK